MYEGYTNDTSGAGINKFHEKCTDQALGGWAYGFLIFYTAMFCLAGVVYSPVFVHVACCVLFPIHQNNIITVLSKRNLLLLVIVMLLL